MIWHMTDLKRGSFEERSMRLGLFSVACLYLILDDTLESDCANSPGEMI